MLIDFYMWFSTILHYDYLIAQHNKVLIIFNYFFSRLLFNFYYNYILHMIITIRYINALMDNRIVVNKH